MAGAAPGHPESCGTLSRRPRARLTSAHSHGPACEGMHIRSSPRTRESSSFARCLGPAAPSALLETSGRRIANDDPPFSPGSGRCAGIDRLDNAGIRLGLPASGRPPRERVRRF
jgi:hypothetical protein